MTPPLVHLGLDIAKATLVGHLAGRTWPWPNTPAGHARLCAQIAAAPSPVHVVCESSGAR